MTANHILKKKKKKEGKSMGWMNGEIVLERSEERMRVLKQTLQLAWMSWLLVNLLLMRTCLLA